MIWESTRRFDQHEWNHVNNCQGKLVHNIKWLKNNNSPFPENYVEWKAKCKRGKLMHQSKHLSGKCESFRMRYAGEMQTGTLSRHK